MLKCFIINKNDAENIDQDVLSEEVCNAIESIDTLSKSNDHVSLEIIFKYLLRTLFGLISKKLALNHSDISERKYWRYKLIRKTYDTMY